MDYKLTIENKFTDFRKETRSRNVQTIKRILRESKARGCLSITTITDEDGESYEIFDIGKGEDLHCIS